MSNLRAAFQAARRVVELSSQGFASLACGELRFTLGLYSAGLSGRSLNICRARPRKILTWPKKQIENDSVILYNKAHDDDEADDWALREDQPGGIGLGGAIGRVAAARVSWQGGDRAGHPGRHDPAYPPHGRAD